MYRKKNTPSLGGSVFFMLFGTAWVAVSIYWTVQQQFTFGGKRGGGTIVTPESHPIFFWGWLLFCFGVGTLALARGVAELRSILRRGRAEQSRRDE